MSLFHIKIFESFEDPNQDYKNLFELGLLSGESYFSLLYDKGRLNQDTVIVVLYLENGLPDDTFGGQTFFKGAMEEFSGPFGPNGSSAENSPMLNKARSVGAEFIYLQDYLCLFDLNGSLIHKGRIEELEVPEVSMTNYKFIDWKTNKTIYLLSISDVEDQYTALRRTADRLSREKHISYGNIYWESY